MIVTIHQPNFFPYEGLLSKIRSSDVFVILSRAQYSKGNYHNRFNIADSWYTMSVNQHRCQLVEKEYSNPEADWATIKRRLPQYEHLLSRFDDCICKYLSSTNTEIIRRLCEMLGIKTRIELDYDFQSSRTGRLVRLCRDFGATTYLSGPSGASYLDFNAFAVHGIEVAIHQPTGSRPALEVLKEHLDVTSI